MRIQLNPRKQKTTAKKHNAMKPIELLKETYIRYLNTDKESLIELRYDRYRALIPFVIGCNLLTLQEIESMETKALIEWESSLTNSAQ